MFEKDHSVNIKSDISSITEKHFPFNMKIVEAQPANNDLKSHQRWIGFPNPFLPGGSVSEDADLIVRMWKEGRLAEMYDQKVIKPEDAEPVDITNNKKTANAILNAEFVEYGVSNKAIQTGSSQIKKKKDKIEKLLCTVI